MIVLDGMKVHKGSYLSCERNNNSNAIFLYGLDRLIYQLNADFELSKVGFLPPEAQAKHNAVSFHPSKNQAAVILNDNSITICDFNGNNLHNQAGIFVNVMYSRCGKFIWAIEKLNKSSLRISVLNSEEGVIAQHECEDELYDSYSALSDIPKSDKIILELIAGQDGVSLYECEYTDSIVVKEFILLKEFPKSCFISPAWFPDGSKLLTLESDAQTYMSFKYPHIEKIAEHTNNFEGEDQQLGYNIIYLKNGLAVIQNADCRYFLFDPIEMKWLDEIAFHGYQPVPANQIYKNLEDDFTLCSRIVSFKRIGGSLLAASTDERDEEAVIILIDEDSICGGIN